MKQWIRSASAAWRQLGKNQGLFLEVLRIKAVGKCMEKTEKNKNKSCQTTESILRDQGVVFLIDS